MCINMVLKGYHACSNRANPLNLTVYLIEAHFDTFANRAGPESTYGNMIRYDPILVELASDFFVLYVQT